jgi:hypothetical protein
MMAPYIIFSFYSLFLEEFGDEVPEFGVAVDALPLSEEAAAGLSAPLPESADFPGPFEVPLVP